MTQTNEEIMVENDKEYGIFDTSVFQPKSDIVEYEPQHTPLMDCISDLTDTIKELLNEMKVLNEKLDIK